MSLRASSEPAAPDAGTFFDGRVELYDRAYDSRGPDGYALRSRMAAVLQLLGDGPGEALDAGMGPGRLLAELAKRGWTVSGVDASAEMAAAARRRVPAAAERLVHGEIEALPFADESFDAVTATGVLEYSDVPRALAELARVLCRGGRAVVSYPNPRALYGVWKTTVFYPAVRSAKRVLRRPHAAGPRGAGRIPPERFAELLATVGLEPQAFEYAGVLIVPSPLDILVPSLSARIGSRLEGRGPDVGRWLATQVVYSARKRT